MEFKSKNYMYYCIEHFIKKFSLDFEICQCESCLSDLKAIALNKLPCKYIYDKNSDVDMDIMNEITAEMSEKIVQAVKEANEIVKKNPRHENQGSGSISIKNYMEPSVIKNITSLMKKENIDMTEENFNEIAVLTLNNLPAKYVASRKGELFSKINTVETQFQVNIITEGIKAIVKFKEK